jgi:RNA binding exosome subunit
MGLKVRRLEVDFLTYPTERVDIAQTIIRNLIEEDRDFTVMKVHSEHGFTIKRILLSIEGKEAEDKWNSIKSRMERSVIEEIASSLDRNLEGAKLHIRFDKQKLLLKDLSLFKGGYGGAVKLIIHYYKPYSVKDLFSEVLDDLLAGK